RGYRIDARNGAGRGDWGIELEHDLVPASYRAWLHRQSAAADRLAGIDVHFEGPPSRVRLPRLDRQQVWHIERQDERVDPGPVRAGSATGRRGTPTRVVARESAGNGIAKPPDKRMGARSKRIAESLPSALT